jgi:hypothetical protein
MRLHGETPNSIQGSHVKHDKQSLCELRVFLVIIAVYKDGHPELVSGSAKMSNQMLK